VDAVPLVWAAAGAASGAVLGPRAQQLANDAGAQRPLAPTLVLEAVTAALFATLAWHIGVRVELLADSWIAAIGVPLAATDIAVQRLPNRLVLPSYPTVIALLGLAALLDHNPAALLRALAGMLTLLALYSVPYHLLPGAIAGGDVKLAGVLGLGLGWASWNALLTGTFLGWALAAISRLALRATHTVSRDAPIPLGAFLITGALAALLTGTVA
jgi:leader peptidase (prepilin peptidase) / N-methyltransferase